MGAGLYTIHGSYDDLFENIKSSNEFFGSRPLSKEINDDVVGVFLEAWIRFSMGFPPEMSAYGRSDDYTQERVEVVDLSSGVYVNVGDFACEMMNYVTDFAELIYHIFSKNKRDAIVSGIQCLISVFAAAKSNVGKLDRKDICVYLMLLDATEDSGVARVADIKDYADKYPVQDENREQYTLENTDIESSLHKMRTLRVIEQTSPDGYRCTF